MCENVCRCRQVCEEEGGIILPKWLRILMAVVGVLITGAIVAARWLSKDNPGPLGAMIGTVVGLVALLCIAYAIIGELRNDHTEC